MLTGKQYMIVMSGAKSTVAALANHPKRPRLKARDSGSTLSDRPCHINKAAGMAKLHCWSNNPELMNALNAVDDPR
jgi:hypothetical protein